MQDTFNSTVWFEKGSTEDIKMHQIVLFLWSFLNVDWYKGLILKNQEKIILMVAYFCVQIFQYINFLLFRLCQFLLRTPTKFNFILKSLNHTGDVHLPNNRKWLSLKKKYVNRYSSYLWSGAFCFIASTFQSIGRFH